MVRGGVCGRGSVISDESSSSRRPAGSFRGVWLPTCGLVERQARGGEVANGEAFGFASPQESGSSLLGLIARHSLPAAVASEAISLLVTPPRTAFRRDLGAFQKCFKKNAKKKAVEAIEALGREEMRNLFYLRLLRDGERQPRHRPMRRTEFARMERRPRQACRQRGGFPGVLAPEPADTHARTR